MNEKGSRVFTIVKADFLLQECEIWGIFCREDSRCVLWNMNAVPSS